MLRGASAQAAAAAAATALPAQRRAAPAARADVVVVGAGTAGAAAAAELRRRGGAGSVLVLDARPGVPNASLGRVTAIDTRASRVVLDSGQTVAFTKCLLATGRAESVPPPGRGAVAAAVPRERVAAAAPAAVAAAVAAVRAGGEHVTVCGSGFDALALAVRLADAAAAGPGGAGGSGGGGRKRPRQQTGAPSQVRLVFPESGVLSRQIPRFLARLLRQRLERRGVEIVPFSLVRFVDSTVRDAPPPPAPPRRAAKSKPPPRLALLTSRTYDGLETHVLPTDRVLLRPARRNANASVQCGPTVERGADGRVFVNAELMASSTVYSAGAGVSAPHALLGRLEGSAFGKAHEAMLGRAAAVSLLDGHESGDAAAAALRLPERRESVLGLSLVFVGDCDAALETHCFYWRRPGAGEARTRYGGGVVFYRRPKDATVRGVAVWGPSAPGSVGDAAAAPPPEGSALARMRQTVFEGCRRDAVPVAALEGRARAILGDRRDIPQYVAGAVEEDRRPRGRTHEGGVFGQGAAPKTSIMDGFTASLRQAMAGKGPTFGGGGGAGSVGGW